jgi:hypothetical protein
MHAARSAAKRRPSCRSFVARACGRRSSARRSKFARPGSTCRACCANWRAPDRVRRLPRLRQAIWGGELVVVWDRAPHLQPYQEDFQAIVDRPAAAAR